MRGPQGEDEALEFARICFPAAAQALRWIEGICMGWGGESKRSEGEQEAERDVTAEAEQMRAEEREERKGGIVTPTRKQQSCPAPRAQTLLCTHTQSEGGGGTIDFYLP
ncbi:Leucine-rich repeat and WD repeat-containing protein 1 [Dissostichus eleginoides]|uniref:Leucine-rich repeat and WD repeat-containing protein 1 n=1 Tax=Dissostichus eleginoides TaxID=100907 RepID=A0AAD9CGQ5_DISEL|nr:Leucine-rich repeat and WD repeat-containing protein 1 [Dissostichus eleginoides]